MGALFSEGTLSSRKFILQSIFPSDRTEDDVPPMQFAHVRSPGGKRAQRRHFQIRIQGNLLDLGSSQWAE